MRKTGLMLLAAFVSSCLYGQSADIAECAKHTDSLDRLECYDRLAEYLDVNRSKSPAADNGKWRVREEVSPLDDSRNVFLSLAADKQVRGFVEQAIPTLVIRCKENKTEVFVNVGVQSMFSRIGTYGAQYYSATIRLDKEPARNIEMTGSTNGKGLFFENDIAIAKELFGRDALLFQFTPFNASPQIATFQVYGLEFAIRPLRKACHW